MKFTDWEERFWALTHDLVVQSASIHPPVTEEDISEAREAIANCIWLASVAVDGYKAILERYPERAL